MPNREKIRLVIWDLDETFWRGTLSEGGIQDHVRAHHDIVVALARRGIVSSICSKNDFATVETILVDQGLWDYFVFPSIDWTAKGPRLRQLVADVQLRPETVLFIDDNASNRAEAAAHVPGLQVADETVIGGLLDHPNLQGKDDTELTRLKQYQLLQRRKSDARLAGSDTASFLRASDIRVLVDPDIEGNLDRAIELINRTNQLNFIKSRLPEDPTAAAQALLGLTRRYSSQAGLIRVWDDYGDHGYCGFYVIGGPMSDRRLLQFCFSCRILGMGVEQWLYSKLGSPVIDIQGDVVSTLDGGADVDWINRDLGGAVVFAEGFAGAAPPPLTGQGASVLAPEIRMRGSCELKAISHYLRQETPKLVELSNYERGAFLIRRDEYTNLALFASGMSDRIKAEIDRFGLFDQDDYDLDLFASPASGTLFVLTGWAEVYMPVYRHRRFGFDIRIAIRPTYLRLPQFANSDIPDPKNALWNLAATTDHELENFFEQYAITPELQTQIRNVVGLIRTDYDWIDKVSLLDIGHRVTTILQRIPTCCPTAILLPNFRLSEHEERSALLHAAVHGAIARLPHVFAVDPTCYVTRATDVQDSPVHLDRMIYFRIYQELIARFAERLSNLAAASVAAE